MKTETLTSSVVKIRNDLQPHFTDNTDIILYDYDFYTALESWAKKEREKAKEKAIALSSKPADYCGILLRTTKQKLTRSISAAPQQFDLNLFIKSVSDQYKIDRFKLVELAGNSKSPGTGRTTIRVEENDD